MPSLSKVRIYDLAKELKQESKRIMEEVRREGVDVSVPSNTISKELAEKIRSRYFPKKEVSVQRTVRVVKKAARHFDDEHSPETDTAVEDHRPAHYEQGESAGEFAHTAAPQAQDAAAKPFAARLVKRLAPALRAEQPPPTPPDVVVAATPPPAAPTISPPVPVQEAVSEHIAPPDMLVESSPSQFVPEPPIDRVTTPLPPTEAPRPAVTAAPPAAARQVRVLRLTPEALNAGVRQGERVQAPTQPPPPTPTPRERDRRSGSSGRERDERGGREQQRAGAAPRGTPGETATPQTTYIPPADARRPRGGRSTRRGASTPAGNFRRGPDGKGGRFERDFIAPARALSLEDRIAGTLPKSAPGSAVGLQPVRLVEGSTVKEFAEKLGIKPKDVVALLLQRGVFATINQSLNDEVAVDLGRRFGFEVIFVGFEEMVAEEEFEDLVAADVDDVEEPRAPVVTVMGHVDHGKTSLLDAIRTTDVAAGEAGGITQHIGAYSVYVPNPDIPAEKRRVVFLDTPGHEAFTMMRARGAKATDVVVLVVAADDGVMPQTIEAIEHARAAHVPIVVAINKIDRPDANPDRVRQGLANQGLQPVEWGGDTEMVLVSAKKRENIESLLETVLLTADILNLRASPTRLASGVVLEAKLDRGRGAVATALVQQGTLRVGDPFIVGQIFGKVRAMFNDRGEQVTEAGPAMPVEVLGLQGVPQAGESFQVVSDVTRAQTISQHRQMVSRQNTLLQTTKRGIEALGEQEVKELLVLIKADVQGSVEVLKSTLQKLSTERVKVKVIRSGVGAITESDVLLASATQAGSSSSAVVIIGFNVRPEVRAAELAKQEAVDIRLHSIIYKVEEEIRAAMIGMLEAIEKERILGKADVREVFRVPRIGAVAGSMVIDGTIRRNARARLIRDGVVAWEGGIASLRRFKDDVSEVRQGFDCGIGLENFNDIKVGDQIEAYVIEKVAATEL
ncbi:MAG: translation initiation factor IF-2 [Acidobacteriota bacterium]|nr:translation initiation factor IF-2 [Acidobacteriota bacterium]